MKKYICFLIILFGSILFAQEINFPDSFDIDLDLLPGYSMPQDDGPNPDLIYKKEDDKISLPSVQRRYFMTLFKDYEEMMESTEMPTDISLLMIIIVEHDSKESVEEVLKPVSKTDENIIILSLDKYTISIIGTDSNRDDANTVANYYINKLNAKLIVN